MIEHKPGGLEQFIKEGESSGVVQEFMNISE